MHRKLGMSAHRFVQDFVTDVIRSCGACTKYFE